MPMGIKVMKKLLISTILVLLLATGAQANQESESSIDKEILTVKSNIKFRPSIDPDVKVEFVIVHKIL